MTTPTQAQMQHIKSAKEFLRVNQGHGHSDTTCTYIAVLLDIIGSLTAAAQVELAAVKVHIVDNEFGIMGGDALAMDALKNATIERCAQVADYFIICGACGMAGKAGAAIRKLKDEP